MIASRSWLFQPSSWRRINASRSLIGGGYCAGRAWVGVGSAAAPVSGTQHRALRRPIEVPMPKRALIVIDVQNEYFDGALPISDPPTETSLANIGRAMDAATAADVPVIVVQHADATPRRRSSARAATRGSCIPTSPRGRTTTSSARSCRARSRAPRSATSWPTAGVDTVSITGYMTHMCVDTTAREAAHRGLGVEILNDATGTLHAREQRRHRDRRGAPPRDARRAGPVLRRGDADRRLDRLDRGDALAEAAVARRGRSAPPARRPCSPSPPSRARRSSRRCGSASR